MGRRIRTIKSELLDDERTSNPVPTKRTDCFIGCILLADDHGNLSAAPARLTARVFWGHAHSGH